MLDRRLFRLAVPLALGSLALTACGGDDTAAPTAPISAASSAVSSASSSAAPSASSSASSSAAPTPTPSQSSGVGSTKVETILDGDGTFAVGTILPQTGSLAILGPPEIAGVNLAIQEINEAGGVLGKDATVSQGDSGDTTTDLANQTVDRLLAANVDVIIGAASSGVSFTVIDKIARAGVQMISPANTSPDFTDYQDGGLYARTAPSDVLQGRVLGNTVVADGNATVGIMWLQDPYGEGLEANARMAIESSGGEVVESIAYDAAAPNFDAEVGRLAAADPEAIIVIGFDETDKIIPTLIEQSVGPADKQIYFVDGNLSNARGEGLPPGTLEGVKGTLPGAAAPGDFRDRLMEIDPDLEDFSYAAESYDAVVIAALAAEAAGNDSGTAIASELADVTREGEKCESYEDCLALVQDDTDIDYDGISGPLEFSDVGDPQTASVGVYTYGADNMLTDDIRYEEGEL